MAVILIDQFTGNTGGLDTVVSIFFNTVTGVVTTTPGVNPPTFESFIPPRVNNDLIYEQCIGDDNYTVLKSTEAPYYILNVEVGSASCVVNPQCDLAVQTLKTDETAQGANDGSISATATSSFANPQISIDNITFYPTPHTFGPLVPGPYTIYGKDDNGCAKSVPLIIGSFGNPISGGFAAGTPEVQVSPGVVSRWNAAFNPIVFSFQTVPDPLKKNYRIELEITTIYGIISGTWSPNPKGFTRADISAYLQTVVNARDEFKHDVINWRDIDRAASFTVRYREIWDGNIGVWFYAPQPFYVTWSAMQLQDKYGGNMAEYVPITSGGVIAPAPFTWTNLQQGAPNDYIDSNLQMKSNGVIVVDSFGNENNVVNMAVGNAYSIQGYVIDPPEMPGFLKLEVIKNGTVVFLNAIPNAPGASLLYAGIVDYGATYVVNAGAYETIAPFDPINIPDSTTPAPSGSNLAKWLTLFEEPTATVGLPFDTSFIFSEYLVNKVVKLRTTSLDINRQPIAGGVVNGFLLNNDGGYVLNTDLSRLIIQQGALPPVANDGIYEQLGINRLMLAGAPAANVEYFQIQLYVGADNAPEYVTQPLIIKINPNCNEPYVLLKWLNTLGGWDYFRFGHDQIMQLTTSDEIVIDRNVFDWQNDDTIEDVVKKTAANRIGIGAQISEVKINGLKGLHTSTKIQMLMSVNPIRWQTVRLQTGSFDIRRARNKVAELRFTITLPEINIQVNGSSPQQVL